MNLNNFSQKEKLALIYLLGNAALAAYPEKFRSATTDDERREILAPLIMQEIVNTSESELRRLLTTTIGLR